MVSWAQGKAGLGQQHRARQASWGSRYVVQSSARDNTIEMSPSERHSVYKFYSKTFKSGHAAPGMSYLSVCLSVCLAGRRRAVVSALFHDYCGCLSAMKMPSF